MLNETTSDKSVAITEEVNLTVQKTLFKQFKTLFSHKTKVKSENEYSWKETNNNKKFNKMIHEVEEVLKKNQNLTLFNEVTDHFK